MEVEPGRYSGAVVVVNGSSVGVVGIFDGIVDFVVVLPDAVEIRWGVNPCGDVVMTKVVVKAAVVEVEGAGVVDRSTV